MSHDVAVGGEQERRLRTQMDYYVIGDRADRNAGVAWTASWATDANTQAVRRADRPVGEQPGATS